MMNTALEAWDKNRNVLMAKLSSLDHFPSTYEELVRMTFDNIWNAGSEHTKKYKLNTDAITKVDDGEYQGTLIFLIPFCRYQPSEYEYLMTFVDYGSCSGCDTLQGIESSGDYDAPPNDEQVMELLQLCKDIICNTIRPYNSGWRHDPWFDAE